MDYSAAIKAAAKAQPSVPNETLIPGRVLHIDGDYAAYSNAGSGDMPPAVARKNLIERQKYANLHARAASRVIHLSGDGCNKGLRGLVATVKPYQAQRVGSNRPANWACLRVFLEHHKESLISYHREADDSMAEAAYADPENTVLHYRDKDMRQLPGWHLTWTDHHLFYVPVGTYEFIGPDKLVYGTKWLWLQMLQGDTADNIPGLEQVPTADGKGWKDCGDGTALALLSACDTNDAAALAVANLYLSFYGESWADRFVEQLALLWLRESAGAPVVDFFTARHSPLPRVWEHYDVVLAATFRLKARVKEAHAEIKIIADRAGEDTPFEYTEW